MGATGLILVAFVILHMAGNLLFFAGAERFNAYSHLLQVDLIELTWLLRITLLAAVVLHIIAAYQLTMRNRAARPADYVKHEPQVSTYAARTMRWGGVYLLLFIPYHLLHFTIGNVHPAFVRGAGVRQRRDRLRGRVGRRFSISARWRFSRCICTTARGRCFGRLASRARRTIRSHRRLALAIAIIVPVGFSLLPLSVMLGFVR